MKRQIPGGEPGVLPLVGHRDDVGAEHVEPVLVAGAGARVALDAALFQPLLHVVDVGLLRPEQPAIPLADDVRGVFAQRRRGDRRVELVRLALPVGEGLVEVGERIGEIAGRPVGEAQANRGALAGLHVDDRVGRGLGPLLRGIDRVLALLHDVVVDSVLLELGGVRLPPEPVPVRLVVGEQEIDRAVAIEKALSERGVLGGDDRRPCGGREP